MSGIPWYGGVLLWAYFIALIVVGLATLLIGGGILFAPIAGLLTGREVSKKSYAFMSGAWRGAFFSASGLLPWIYMAVTMKGWKLPRGFTEIGFILMHILWLAAIILVSFLVLQGVEDFNSYVILFVEDFNSRLPENKITLTFVLVSGIFWIVASGRLMEKRRNWQDEEQIDVLGMPNMSGILHFTFPTAWIIGVALVIFTKFILDLPEPWDFIVLSVTAGSLIVATTVWTLWGDHWKLSIEPGS